MQVSIETTSGLERRMTVEVPATVVDTAVKQRLQESAGKVNLNGFRKGKVPMSVVKNRFGKAIRQEVVGEVMSKTYFDALQEQKIQPAGQPQIEPKVMEEGKDLEFVAVFEVYPEVELADFSKIKIEKLTSEVGEKDIDTMIENLREQRQGWKPVKRMARNKDKLNIDFVGTIDGVEFEGGSAKGTDLVLGSKQMIEGFEKGLVKAKPEQEVVLDLEFPEDYHNKDLAGKPVQFTVTVNSVEAPELPELDDEFFAVFGITEGGIDAFKKEVESNMQRELANASKAKLKNQVMEKVLEAHSVDLPSALVKGEIDALRQQALQQFGAGAKDLDPAMLPDDLFKEQAEKRVGLGLILGEVIKSKELKVDADKVKATIEDLASTYETPEQVVQWYYSNKEQMAAVESSVLEDQAFDAIVADAKVTEKKVSYEDMIKADAPKASK
ncbi:MAG: trigger factor [Pseudohongiellaceae bacterium]|nr:trigger factor [Pseudohongiellaceae bacterium]